MTHVAAPTQPVITFFFALFMAVVLTIAGCSASTISGPEVTPSGEPTVHEVASTPGPNASHNEDDGAGKGGDGSTTGGSNGAGHND